MMTSRARQAFFTAFFMLTCGVPGVKNISRSARDVAANAPARRADRSCFLLYEVGVGETRRAPSTACRTRISPQSTFKIPHALAALDSGVVAGPDTTFSYDGSPQSFDAWRRDHTLASAMRFSVVRFFQRIAEKLGETRERDYLRRFAYGELRDRYRSDRVARRRRSGRRGPPS
jgi:beta-lactamase class D